MTRKVSENIDSFGAWLLTFLRRESSCWVGYIRGAATLFNFVKRRWITASVSRSNFRRNSLKWLEETPIKVIVYKRIQLRIFKYVCFKLFKKLFKSKPVPFSLFLSIHPFYHFSNIETRPNIIDPDSCRWETLYPFLVVKVPGKCLRVSSTDPFPKNHSNLLSSLLPSDCHTCLTCISLFGIVRGIRVATSNVS